MTNLFPEPEGINVGVDDEGFTKISRTDLQSYLTYLEGVEKRGPGFEARLMVPTGEPVVTRDGKRTGRGKVESRHDRAFRQAAADKGLGIRIVPERMADGQTMLRIAITKKREFTDLTNARRDRGRINYQAGQALAKANKAKQVNDPEAGALMAHAEDLASQVKQLDVVVADLEKVLADYAQSIGKKVDNLSPAEIRQAFAEPPPEPPAPKAGARK